MATPSANGNYSLAALNWCAGAFSDKDGSADDNRTLAAGANGGTAADVKMSDFMIDSFSKPSNVTASSNSGSVTRTCAFGNAESRFSARTRAKTKPSGNTTGPFYWNETGSTITIINGNGWGKDDYNANMTFNNTGNAASFSYQVGFRDHYNKNATGYSTNDSDVQTAYITIPAAEGGGRGGDDGGRGDEGGGRR